MQEAGSRHLTHTIPADRLLELSSALEFYPSQGEAEEMAEEARGEADGNAASGIAQERYLEVLEQHRPVEGLDESQLEKAFQVHLIVVQVSHNKKGNARSLPPERVSMRPKASESIRRCPKGSNWARVGGFLSWSPFIVCCWPCLSKAEHLWRLQKTARKRSVVTLGHADS
jgi:hypothetical protein